MLKKFLKKLIISAEFATIKSHSTFHRNSLLRLFLKKLNVNADLTELTLSPVQGSVVG